MRIRAMKKRTQNEPNLLNAQMNISSILTKDYENVPLRRRGENKPNQTQFFSYPNPPDSHNYQEMKWRRRESNPHFRDATAACSRYTTSPESSSKAFFRKVSKSQKLFKSCYTKNLELPLIIAEYFLYRLALRLLWLIGRITNRHQLDYSDISRNIQYCLYFVRIERPNPARRQP